VELLWSSVKVVVPPHHFPRKFWIIFPHFRDTLAARGVGRLWNIHHASFPDFCDNRQFFNVGPETGQIGQPFFLCALIVVSL
jgi:hypothetical protein